MAVAYPHGGYPGNAGGDPSQAKHTHTHPHAAPPSAHWHAVGAAPAATNYGVDMHLGMGIAGLPSPPGVVGDASARVGAHTHAHTHEQGPHGMSMMPPLAAPGMPAYMAMTGTPGMWPGMPGPSASSAGTYTHTQTHTMSQPRASAQGPVTGMPMQSMPGAALGSYFGFPPGMMGHMMAPGMSGWNMPWMTHMGQAMMAGVAPGVRMQPPTDPGVYVDELLNGGSLQLELASLTMPGSQEAAIMSMFRRTMQLQLQRWAQIGFQPDDATMSGAAAAIIQRMATLFPPTVPYLNAMMHILMSPSGIAAATSASTRAEASPAGNVSMPAGVPMHAAGSLSAAQRRVPVRATPKAASPANRDDGSDVSDSSMYGEDTGDAGRAEDGGTAARSSSRPMRAARLRQKRYRDEPELEEDDDAGYYVQQPAEDVGSIPSTDDDDEAAMDALLALRTAAVKWPAKLRVRISAGGTPVARDGSRITAPGGSASAASVSTVSEEETAAAVDAAVSLRSASSDGVGESNSSRSVGDASLEADMRAEVPGKWARRTRARWAPVRVPAAESAPPARPMASPASAGTTALDALAAVAVATSTGMPHTSYPMPDVAAYAPEVSHPQSMMLPPGIDIAYLMGLASSGGDSVYTEAALSSILSQRRHGQFGALTWVPSMSKYACIYRNDSSWAIVIRGTKTRTKTMYMAEAFFEAYCDLAGMDPLVKLRPGYDPARAVNGLDAFLAVRPSVARPGTRASLRYAALLGEVLLRAARSLAERFPADVKAVRRKPSARNMRGGGLGKSKPSHAYALTHTLTQSAAEVASEDASDTTADEAAQVTDEQPESSATDAPAAEAVAAV